MWVVVVVGEVVDEVVVEISPISLLHKLSLQTHISISQVIVPLLRESVLHPTNPSGNPSEQSRLHICSFPSTEMIDKSVNEYGIFF